MFYLTVWQPVYFITGECMKLAGPYGRSLYYPTIGPFIGQLILIVVLFAPYFILVYYFNNLNKILFRDWYKKYGKDAEEELKVPIELNDGTKLNIAVSNVKDNEGESTAINGGSDKGSN